VSVKASQWAWERGRELQLKAGTFLTLLRVADHADGSGVCWPGLDLVADYTAQGLRTVEEHMVKLDTEHGLLHRERESARKAGRGRFFDKIVLHLDLPANLAGGSQGAPEPGTAPGANADLPAKPAGGSGSDLPANSDRPTREIAGDLPANSDGALHREPTTEPKGTKNNSDPVSAIYDFWKQQTGRNGSTRLTPNRRTVVRARLDEGREIAFVKQAIVNVAASDWHMKRGKFAKRDGLPQSDLTLICRNGETLEKYAAMGADGGSSGAAGSKPKAPITDPDGAAARWDTAKERLKASIEESTHSIWVEPFEAAGERDGTLVLVDTTEQGGISSWAARRYTTLFLEALEGAYTAIEIVDEKQLELEAA